MRSVGLILAVATREEINQWTRRHRGRREITRVRVAAAGRHSNLSDLISTQVAATVCAVNDDGDGDKNLGYDGYPVGDPVPDGYDYGHRDAKGYEYTTTSARWTPKPCGRTGGLGARIRSGGKVP